MQIKYKEKLLSTLRNIIKEQSIGTQVELAYALSILGYSNVSQARISRMLQKLGATRVRDTHNKFIYILPNESVLPKNKQAINTMVLSVENNGMLIVLKTILGGAIVISRVLETMGKSFGILGCISDDNSVVVIPTAHDKVEELTQTIKNYLEVEVEY